MSRSVFRVLSGLSTLAVLVSCSDLSDLSGTGKTRITFGGTRSGTAGALAAQSGGIFIWGVSATEKMSLFLSDESSGDSRILGNGNWTFYSAGWDGSSKFEGAVRCGSQTAVLAGAPAKVEITISPAGCADPFFGPSAFKNSNEPQALRLVTCQGFSSVVNGASNCDSIQRGTMRSYQVKLLAYDSAPRGATSVAGNEISSQCYNLTSTSGNSITNTAAKIPVGDGGVNPLIHTVISGFPNPGCSSTERKFVYSGGIYGGSQPAAESQVFDDAIKSVLFLDYSTLGAVPTVASIAPPAGHLGGGETIVITGTNLRSPTVSIGGSACAVSASTDTTVTCTTPALTSGAKSVVLTGDDGQVSSPGTFTARFTLQSGVAGVSTHVNGTAIDSSGNVVIAGYTQGNLDGQTLTGVQDAFVSKYDPSGNLLWTRLTGLATKITEATAVIADGYGHVYIAGKTNGGLDGNTLTGTTDFFIINYDAAGAKTWTHQLGAAGAGTFATSVAVESSANTVVAGYTLGNLDGNTLNGSSDFFLTYYDNSGTKQWTRTLGAAGVQVQGSTTTFDGLGNVYIAGKTNGAIDGQSQTGLWDLFVTEYNISGVKQWTRQLGAATPALSTTAAVGLGVGPGQDLYVTGSTTGNLDGHTLAGISDAFTVKYDTSGTKLGSTQLGSASTTVLVRGLSFDFAASEFVIAGSASGNYDGNVCVGSSSDLFATRYQISGTKLWTKMLGVSGADTFGYGVGVDTSGNAYIGGVTTGGLDGNSRTGVDDAFVAKFNSSGLKQ